MGFLRFKMFNSQFEELHVKQSQWTVPDTELRESLRLAVAEVLLPAYRSFVKRFGSVHFHTCLIACFLIHTYNTSICLQTHIHTHNYHGSQISKFVRGIGVLSLMSIQLIFKDCFYLEWKVSFLHEQLLSPSPCK